MFTRVLRHVRNRRGRILAPAVALALVAAPLFLVPEAASAATSGPSVALQSGVNECNGVRPTPGSENTTKRLDPNYPSDFNPGGTVGYIIDYPVDPTDVAGRTTFVITDCIFVDGSAAAKYLVSFVPNTAQFELRFAVPIPVTTPLGAEFCNYAKTTAAPSQSQASNRKAGPACFTVGGALRIEKRSGSVDGPLLPGASFSVVCRPTVTVPPTVITGLDPSQTNADASVSATGVAGDGTIAVGGPSGTPCTVTETAAPSGYVLDSTPRDLVIPVGSDQTVSVFVNQRFGSLQITKAADAAGTFLFDIDCSDNSFDRSGVAASPGHPYTLESIPTGTSCTVTERSNPLFSSVVVPSDGTLVIGPGVNTVAFTNTAKPNGIDIDKTVNGHDTSAEAPLEVEAGSTLSYQVVITNSGLVPLSIAALSDSLQADLAASCSPSVETVLNPGQTVTCSYTTTAVDPGQASIIHNTVTVSGLDVFERSAGPAHDETFVHVVSAAIHLDKAADRDAAHVGDTITYTLTVTNPGNSPLRLEPIDDDVCDGAATLVSKDGEDGRLDPGETWVYQCSHLVVDGDGNKVVNSATVTGSDRFEHEVHSTDDASTDILRPAIAVTKTGPAQLHVGDTAVYTIVVTNAGNTPLRHITVQDPKCDASAPATTDDDGTLSPGESWTYHCSHLVADGDGDRILNTATADGTDPLEEVVHGTANHPSDILRPAIAVTKTGPANVHVGDPVVYTIVVTNPGNVPLTDVKVTDPKCDGAPVRSNDDADGRLSPGETWTYHCSHVATAADGTSIVNTAKAEGTDPLGQPVTSTGNQTALVLHPAIAIDKTANPVSVAGSGTVTYTYVVTNPGDTTLFNVLVTDDILGPIGQLASLAPGESATLFKTVDVDTSTPPTNVGTAVGTDVLGEKVTANDSATISVVLGEQLTRPAPAAELPRTGSPLQAETRAAIALIEVGLLLELSARHRRRTRRRAD